MKRILLIAAALLLLPSGNLYGQALEDSLLAHYPFNGDADDASGNGRDGMVVGAILTEDRFGNPESAYIFDGVDDYIDVGSDLAFDGPSEVTVSAWIRPNQISERVKVVTKGSNVGFDRALYTWELTVSPTVPINLPGGVRFNVSNGSVDANALTTGIVTVGSWHHVVGTYDGTLTRVYLDGALQGTSSEVSGVLNDEAGPLQIGRENEDGAGGDEFSGGIDAVRVYNRALSEAEVQELFDLKTTSVEPTDTNVPGGHRLSYVYPNPFSQSASVHLTLSRPQRVRVEVIGLLGNRVALLHDAELAPEQHVFKFDAGGLPSGMYQIRMVGEDFVATRRAVFIR